MNNQTKILEYASRKAIIKPKEIEEIGISRQTLYRLYREGKLIRISRGAYSVRDIEPTEWHTLAIVAVAFPQSVICLLSALQFHNLTTQAPHKVWIAFDRKKNRRSLKSTHLPVSIVYFSGESFSKGIEIYNIEGVNVRIYSAAKTVADCFKFRNKIGLDVAIEALKDCIYQRKATPDQIWQFAKICRVAKIIRPYMEAVAWQS